MCSVLLERCHFQLLSVLHAGTMEMIVRHTHEGVAVLRNEAHEEVELEEEGERRVKV